LRPVDDADLFDDEQTADYGENINGDSDKKSL
jgi:hypothetical protein